MSSTASVFPTCFSMMLFTENDKGHKETEVIEERTFLYLRGGHVKNQAYAKFGETGSREPLTSRMHTRFYLVPSKKHRGEQLVHIRSSYNNKYLVANEVEWHDDLVVGTVDKEEEGLSRPSCTLFKIQIMSNHGGRQQVRFLQPSTKRPASFVATSDFIDHKTGHTKKYLYPDVDLVDVTDQIILPPYLSFKRDNGWYLGCVATDYSTHLEFRSGDKADKSFLFTTLNYPDGQVSIKSELVGRYLLYTQDNWIVAEGADISICHSHVLFKVLKFGNFVVLQSGTNKLFCTTNKKGNIDHCLEASAAEITDNVKLTIEEPVLGREIYNIEYHRSDHAKVEDTTDMNMATAVAYNETSEKNTVKSSMSVTTTASVKHESTGTHKTDVGTSVSAGFTLFGLVDAGVQVSGGYEYTKANSWGDASETEKKQQIEYEVTVPSKKKVTLTVTAKQVKCNIPFSYTQKDRLLNGESRIYEYDDGLYTGVNCLDLSYTTKEEDIEPQEEENESSKKRKGM